ncbi:MAG: CPBP family intramembrane metalloprotease [Bacteroidales bacterium]|nr:CPBP family intramembrane metalloprotease [Bacteroidales bacterium]
MFIHADSWLRIISFAGLALAAVIISLSVRDIKSLLYVLGIVPFTRKVIYYSVAGIILGMLLGLMYNFIKADSLLPSTLTKFALMASLIGITEELVFRGFVQSRSASSGPLASVIITASGHTLYKYLVIMTVPVDLNTDIPSFVLLTFLAGVVFGIMREASRSVIPPALAHALFDIIVYGGASLAPVWIWS